jgi:hypothetical protein
MDAIQSFITDLKGIGVVVSDEPGLISSAFQAVDWRLYIVDLARPEDSAPQIRLRRTGTMQPTDGQLEGVLFKNGFGPSLIGGIVEGISFHPVDVHKGGSGSAYEVPDISELSTEDLIAELRRRGLSNPVLWQMRYVGGDRSQLRWGSWENCDPEIGAEIYACPNHTNEHDWESRPLWTEDAFVVQQPR